jgi:hypothetical protein
MGRARYIATKRLPIRHPLSARQADGVEIAEPRKLGPARTELKEIVEPGHVCGSCTVPAVPLESDQRSDQCYRTVAINVIIDVPEAVGPRPVA